MPLHIHVARDLIASTYQFFVAFAAEYTAP